MTGFGRAARLADTAHVAAGRGISRDCASEWADQ